MFGGRWERYQTAGESTRARAKLADVPYHDLRHTFASWAVQRRVSLLELRDLLGHSSLQMVQRYSHLAPEHLRAAASSLEGILVSKEAANRAVEVKSVGPVRQRTS